MNPGHGPMLIHWSVILGTFVLAVVLQGGLHF